jgi:hypothetical protein
MTDIDSLIKKLINIATHNSVVNSTDSVTYNMIMTITHQASYLGTHNPIRDAIYSEIWNDLERNAK